MLLATGFFAAAGLLVYVYFGYPALLWLLGLFRNPRKSDDVPPVHPVSVIVAAYNEESVIGARVRNLLDQRYPEHLVEILIASDGSRDGTNDIVRSLSASHPRRVRLVTYPTNRGRAAIHNDAIAAARGEILVFTDADTRFEPDFLECITRPFADASVGCVSGQLRYENVGSTGISHGLGVYWRYEHWLRAAESRLGTYASGSGACMAIRRNLLSRLSPNEDIDTVGPLDAILRGYRVCHEPSAVARDEMPATVRGEVKARVRIIVQSMEGRVRRRALLNPFRRPGYAWTNLSHKLLRWLSPYFLIVAAATSVGLVLATREWLWVAAVAVQAAFYGLALVGYVLERLGWRVPVLSTAWTFCVVNVGFLVGTLAFLVGRRTGAYESQA